MVKVNDTVIITHSIDDGVRIRALKKNGSNELSIFNNASEYYIEALKPFINVGSDYFL